MIFVCVREQFLFASLMSRDNTYELMVSVWRRNQLVCVFYLNQLFAQLSYSYLHNWTTVIYTIEQQLFTQLNNSNCYLPSWTTVIWTVEQQLFTQLNNSYLPSSTTVIYTVE